LQTDQESWDFADEAVSASWRNQVTVSSVEAILEHAPAKSI
jgi:hypothetical protein